MRVGIHQLHYLPWLRYFEKIQSCDVFVVLDDIQFNKNGWQNRNRVKTSSGAVLLTVPVQMKFAQRLGEVRIDERTPWRKKHWKTIEQSYGRAPFFFRVRRIFWGDLCARMGIAERSEPAHAGVLFARAWRGDAGGVFVGLARAG